MNSTVRCEFDGKIVQCKVIEDMGYQGGNHVKAVEYEGKERIVIRIGAIWKPKAGIDKIRFSNGYKGQKFTKEDGK